MNQPTPCQADMMTMPHSALVCLVSQDTESPSIALRGPFWRSSRDHAVAIATAERMVGAKKTERKKKRPISFSLINDAKTKPITQAGGPKNRVKLSVTRIADQKFLLPARFW